MTPPADRRYPLWAYAVFFDPARVDANLARVARAGLAADVPNLWQLGLGVARMVHRAVTRPSSIGLSVDNPRRPGWRARLLDFRPIRVPFVLAAGAVAPWDLSGLLSSPARLIRHLVGTHHDGSQFVYDLELLAIDPLQLERLRDEARAVVDGTHPHAALLRDLCVYEGYHEALLDRVERALAGDFALTDAEARDPDVSFTAYLAWCAAQPATPAETLAAWRAGALDLSGPAPAPSPRSEASRAAA